MAIKNCKICGADAEALEQIIQTQDRKIKIYLAEKQKTQFFYASYLHKGNEADFIVEAHRMGFDNYPLAQEVFPEKDFLFLEKLIGCNIQCLDNKAYNPFHNWCEPIIIQPDEVYNLHFDINKNKTWLAYLDSVKKYYARCECVQNLPLQFMGFNLLDAACSICGTEKLFLYMYDAEKEVDYLLDYITDLQLELFRSLKMQGFKLVNGYGFPCLSAGDLLLPNLPPYLVRRFILPRYFRAAKEAGGMMLGFNCSDLELVKTVLENDSIINCGFDTRIPLAKILGMIGNKLFSINSPVYDPAFDRPTLKDGIWCNPISPFGDSYGKVDLAEVYRELGEKCSMIIRIERYTLEEVCRVKEELFSQLRQEKKEPLCPS